MSEREKPRERTTNHDILNALSYHVWKRYFDVIAELEQNGKEKIEVGTFYNAMDKFEKAGFVESRLREPTKEEAASRRSARVKEFKLTETGLKKRLEAPKGAPGLGLPESA